MPNFRARQMRNHPTEAESLLWQHLRRSQILGRKFRRQEPIGPYIVDFLYFDPMLAIEIDGSQHTGLIAYDAERSSFLERRGFKVIRFWNHEVLAQTDRVREAIRQRIEELMGSPTPSPPPVGPVGRGNVGSGNDGAPPSPETAVSPAPQATGSRSPRPTSWY